MLRHLPLINPKAPAGLTDFDTSLQLAARSFDQRRYMYEDKKDKSEWFYADLIRKRLEAQPNSIYDWHPCRHLRDVPLCLHWRASVDPNVTLGGVATSDLPIPIPYAAQDRQYAPTCERTRYLDLLYPS